VAYGKINILFCIPHILAEHSERNRPAMIADSFLMSLTSGVCQMPSRWSSIEEILIPSPSKNTVQRGKKEEKKRSEM
jgi:hypothetical protein